MKYVSTILIIVFTFCYEGVAQNTSDLEKQKKELLIDISNIQNKLSNSKKEKILILSNVEDVKYKTSLQEKLIENMNDQLNLIVSNIDQNEIEFKRLRDREISLKDELSKMILKSYKTKSSLNKIKYIFSSSSFYQAFKRIQYFKQYANYQSKILSRLDLTKSEINKTIVLLDSQKMSKELLIKENRLIRKELDSELLNLNQLVYRINQNQKIFAQQINSKQKLSREIDEKIQKIIADALAKSKRNEKGFELTAESKLISKNFNNNKGKLPWPVEKGYVVLGFGKQPHPIVKTATIQSNGVRIRTSKNSYARSIFEGDVYSVILSKNNLYTILIQHGSFFTAYKNLEAIFVKKGEKVKLKQKIGGIATDKITKQTLLSFSIFKDGVPQNPGSWIYKM
tara:strand:- start:4248 stop:5438 length:1191 start_codon:yes stop_codon:yes gene_type:complete